jgi:hypothetical protein
MNGDTWIFLALCGALLVFLLMASFLSKSYSLDRIKSKTVGDGQHGTARWATPKEISNLSHRPLSSPPLAQGEGAAHGAGAHPRQRGRRKT